MEELKQFPQAIANLSLQILEMNNAIAKLDSQIAENEAAADAEIVFDPELKNELQRKVRRNELLMLNASHRELLNKADDRKYDVKQAVVQLELLKNQFEVAKLEARREIAVISAGANS
jgi:hypothetical protein